MNLPNNESKPKQKNESERESSRGPVGPGSSIRIDLSEEGAVIVGLANSRLYKHFLERFLEGIGRPLCVPWWGVHLTFYLVMWAAFVLLLDVQRLYPNAGYFSFGGEQIGELMFTTFMLSHIRKCRTTAILTAARINSTKDRLIWLHRYLTPTYWGWVVQFKSHRQRGSHHVVIRVWFLTVCIVVFYLFSQFIYYYGRVPWLPHARSPSDLFIYPLPQILHVYATTAKAAMVIAGAAHFQWLYGLMAIVRGRYTSTLNLRQRRLLYLECCQAALRLSMFVSAAAAIWASARALAYGFTFWSYLYSVFLFVLFAAQVVIINDMRPYRGTVGRSLRDFFREIIAPDFAISWQFAGTRRFATVAAVWCLILCPGPLAQLVTSLGNL